MRRSNSQTRPLRASQVLNKLRAKSMKPDYVLSSFGAGGASDDASPKADGPEKDKVNPKSYLSGTIFLVASSTGLGTLAIPSVFSEFGVKLGFLLLVFSTMLGMLANTLLILSADRARELKTTKMPMKADDNSSVANLKNNIPLSIGDTVNLASSNVNFYFTIFLVLDFFGGWAAYANALVSFAVSIFDYFIFGKDLQHSFYDALRYHTYAITFVFLIFGVLFLYHVVRYINNTAHVEKKLSKTEKSDEKTPSAEQVPKEDESNGSIVDAVLGFIGDFGGFVCISAVVICVVYDYFHAENPFFAWNDPRRFSMKFPKAPNMIASLRDKLPLMVISFLIQHMLLVIIRDMALYREEKKFKEGLSVNHSASRPSKISEILKTGWFMALFCSQLLVLIIYTTVGIFAYWQYGPDLMDNIINNKPQNVEWMVLRVCYAIILFIITPPQWRSCTDLVRDYFKPSDGSTADSIERVDETKRFVWIRQTGRNIWSMKSWGLVYFICVFVPLIIVVFIESFSTILGLFGGVVDSLIMLVFPGLVFLIIRNSRALTTDNLYSSNGEKSSGINEDLGCERPACLMVWNGLAVIALGFGVLLFVLGMWIAYRQSSAISFSILAILLIIICLGCYSHYKRSKKNLKQKEDEPLLSVNDHDFHADG